jgi:hypothetical protein
MPKPGIIIWTSPLGHTYRVQPPPIMSVSLASISENLADATDASMGRTL